jgi:hypothetical protein
VFSAGKQPTTQLSLDYLLQENYAGAENRCNLFAPFHTSTINDQFTKTGSGQT